MPQDWGIMPVVFRPLLFGERRRQFGKVLHAAVRQSRKESLVYLEERWFLGVTTIGAAFTLARQNQPTGYR